MRDHRGNGKIERLIRTINERLRTKKKHFLDKRQIEAVGNFIRAKNGGKADGKLPFEILYGRKPNTVKSNIVDKIKGVSEVDPGQKSSTSDFEEEVDSMIMVRERTRGSQLESQLRKRAGKIVKETAHTITFLLKDGKKDIVYSKRELVKTKPQKKRTIPNPREEQAGPSSRWNETEESSEDETYVVSEETKDEESTPTDTTITKNVDDTAESENEREPRPGATETEGEETAIPQEMPTHQETANPVEDNNPGKGKREGREGIGGVEPPTKRKSPKTANRALRD